MVSTDTSVKWQFFICIIIYDGKDVPIFSHEKKLTNNATKRFYCLFSNYLFAYWEKKSKKCPTHFEKWTRDWNMF